MLDFRHKAEQFKNHFLQLSKEACICECDEVLYGKAGYIIGGLMLGKQTEIMAVIESMVQSGRQLSEHVKSQGYRDVPPLFYVWPPGSRASPYFGGAHGLLGIVYSILQHQQACQTYNEQLQGCLRYILSQECDEQGNFGKGGHFPTKMIESRKSPLVHWCHGSPGAVFVLTKAFQIYGDTEFLEAACRAGEVVWKKGLLKKGPGLCHGVSGNGLVLLHLYKVTGNNKWLFRALQFAQFATSEEFLRGSNTPDRPHSLFEGWAGMCCFLAALSNPTLLGFPFYEVIL
eukprot:TRINITY_DN8878_c0_g1_i1.p1 TRINITY_DN8878_c0_g1~~TRINITY_DN8878_c0_g1_i1.p1  ORF type:complete len:323 (-),score=29.96 TRINITY_DN8878_c0_g1_i1:204-1064(-)